MRVAVDVAGLEDHLGERVDEQAGDGLVGAGEEGFDGLDLADLVGAVHEVHDEHAFGRQRVHDPRDQNAVVSSKNFHCPSCIRRFMLKI